MPLIQAKPCPSCKGQNPPLEVTAEQLAAYHRGTLIQRAFPHLTNDQRETLMTGLCAKCWEDMFSEDEKSS